MFCQSCGRGVKVLRELRNLGRPIGARRCAPTMSHDVKAAFLYAWLVVSLVAGAAVAAPFVGSPERLHSLFPACEARVKRHVQCPLCGMTTAFISVAHGRWREARAANPGAIPLFFAFSVNLAVALLYWLSVVGRSRRLRR
jgi:hypothetical protein